MLQFERDGIRLYFGVAGNPDAPPILFLHGFRGEHRLWYPVMWGLGDTYRSIAPDLRGRGRSSAPEGVDAYGMNVYVEDLGALMDHLEIELAAIVGCSFGGMIALQFAVNCPERVAALCITDALPAAVSDRYSSEFGEREERLAELEEVVRQGATLALVRRGHVPAVSDPALAAEIARRTAAMSTDGYLGIAYTRRTRPDLIPLLRERLTMPVLLCTGDQDPVRSGFRAMRDELPDARAVTFADLGHGVPFADPDRFLKELSRFLGDVEEGRATAGDRTA
ncbi:MAG TPA: alpha/beta hydrolase [Dehalococcoidia bacterium]|nr:alpha/beta hydrolase [Dehalococcoidia bacterium]